MRGTIFIALNDMIEKQFGIEVWDNILAIVKPECDGVYVATEDYPDHEAMKFITVISDCFDIDK